MTKVCSKCEIEKNVDEFIKDKTRKDGLRTYCKDCATIYRKNSKEWFRKWHLKNKEKNNKRNNKYYLNNKEELLKRKTNERKTKPWYGLFNNINARCNNKNHISYKYYGDRGIKSELTLEEIKFIYIRDNAFKMLNPSIHRINNNGNYALKNCKFIEKSEHVTYHNKLRAKIS